jgi:thiosulfate/3-mercaptopyruvate sulfurtransferase
MSGSNSSSSNYAHPEVLVDTQWVEDHTKDSNVRIA